MSAAPFTSRAALVAALLALPGAVWAAEPPPAPAPGSTAAMSAELEALKARIAELEKKENDNWLTEDRANQIRGIVETGKKALDVGKRAQRGRGPSVTVSASTFVPKPHTPFQWAALDVLFPLVYGELRRLARRQLARERPGHTLDSVALVNEAYLKLVEQGNVRLQNRVHFFAVSARAMRAILVDYARARNAAKRGGGGVAVPLDEVAELLSDEQAEHVEQLDEALTRLAGVNEEASRAVECLYFGGLTLDETAEALGMSVATVRRRWSFAKAWLGRTLQPGT